MMSRTCVFYDMEKEKEPQSIDLKSDEKYKKK